MRVTISALSVFILACSGDSNPMSNLDPIPSERSVQTIHPLLGVRIAAEVDDDSYDRNDYKSSNHLEADIVNQQGGLFSPYSLECLDSASETDIEHIVAAAEAHASGMHARTKEERGEFAGDLDNLTLATPSLNRYQKSDKDPAEWMPDNNRCWYVGKWVEIKRKYNLTMDQAEADSISAVYRDCASFDMIQPVCAAGLPESSYYDFRWSRWGDGREEVQSTEQDTLTYTQVDSAGETGSVIGALTFNDEVSDMVTVLYSFTDNALSSGSYVFGKDVPATRMEAVKAVLEERYGTSEEEEGFIQWRRNERTWARLHPATEETPLTISYVERQSAGNNAYDDLPLRVVIPSE